MQPPCPELLRGGLSRFTEGDTASVLAPLPGEGWGCIGWDLFYQCRGFFCRAAQGGPERARLSADIAGEPGRGAGDSMGMAPTWEGAPGHTEHPESWVHQC